ncbi:uncharacterized protein Z518_02903 [Rhinocladiella mackenziei CBS 650.93]|uniref:PH domain-containing protein n=1 Tax=Rhinocladiella mackenziei CBS 650.93 TaxID=1442369 RepID=A0A0D2G127_9EURO|nr:uncharacterized protein Z518_02903 [Rhinocladiella mackenziei CBS 650.93]KIX08247.1 hypothetical protein Z518_02903 [Rhinocladiella mackenziei CBS 650.93]
MAATSPLRPSTPSHLPLDAPRLSPSRMPPAFVPQTMHTPGHRNLDVFSPVDQNGSFCFDRVIKRGKVHRRVKNKGAWKPSWKPAYLVLRPNLLSLYQNQDETDLKISITLSEVTTVAPVRKPHTENVFGVFSPSKNSYFQGLSPADTADWIVQIRQEARTEEEDDLDLLAPQLSRNNVDLSHVYESTDLSADEMHNSPDHHEIYSVTAPNRPRNESQLAPRQRRTSTLQEYSGNEHYTTSNSDVSDALGSSLPKNSTTSLQKQPALTPIASSQQLTAPADAKGTAQQGPPVSGLDPTTDPERVIRHGHLQILKSYKTGVKGWKWIWVVLRSRSLAFYKNEQEYAAVKIIPMRSIINAAEIDPVSKSKNFCFQLITDDKSYRFSTPDEDDLAKWLGALKSVLSKRNEAEKALAKGKQKGIVEATAAMSLR